MPLNITNNAVSLLAAAIGSGAQTSVTIVSGDEIRFPKAAVSTGDWFVITVIANDGRREIMKCTNRSGVVLTVVRGHESTQKYTFPINSRVEVRLTAGTIIELTNNASNLTQGTLSDARLPPRLRPIQKSLGPDGNANNVSESGRYWAPGLPDPTLNVPVANTHGYLWCDVASAQIQHQEWQQYNTDERYRRQKVGNVWGAWEKIWNIKPDLVPIGSVLDYAGIEAAVPTGWLVCDGRQLNRVTYAALYNVIGLHYTPTTGIPVANFCIPDARGRVVAGVDNMGAAASANRLTKPDANTTGGIDGDILGAVGGLETHVLTDAQLSSHVHTLSGSTGVGTAHTHVTPYASFGASVQAGGPDALIYKEITITPSRTTAFVEDEQSHTHSLAGKSTDSLGSDKPHNNVQPTIIMNKIIKAVA